MRVLPYGSRAVLLEVASADLVAPVAAAVAAEGVVDVVPGARTVLVVFDSAARRAEVWPRLVSLAGAARPVSAADGVLVEVPVTYDGEDLAEVAASSGLSVREVVALHCGVEYRAAFCGFSPGFAYLVGLDQRLHLARRASPRPRVPEGSVAVAGEYTAVYPSASPGGWRLLGRTRAAMWDSARTPPALLTPGTRVRFVPEPS